jgi:hypothetical protein
MDYSKTKIYKIYSHLGDKIYIGSTTKDRLCDRMTKHRSGYKIWKNGTGYPIRSYDLFDLYGIENCKIELIEAKECINKDEKNKLEGGYIRTLECVNKNIPDRTSKEYYQDNKDEILIKCKKNYEKNKEKIKERVNKYNITNNEIILLKKKEFRENNKEKIIEQRQKYNETHIDKIKVDKKAYYEKNKEILKEKRKLYLLRKKSIS